jgi:hypothetical protein
LSLDQRKCYTCLKQNAGKSQKRTRQKANGQARIGIKKGIFDVIKTRFPLSQEDSPSIWAMRQDRFHFLGEKKEPGKQREQYTYFHYQK